MWINVLLQVTWSFSHLNTSWGQRFISFFLQNCIYLVQRRCTIYLTGWMRQHSSLEVKSLCLGAGACFCRWSSVGRQPCPVLKVLSMDAFALQQQSRVFASGSIWPQSLKYILSGPLQKKFCNLWLRITLSKFKSQFFHLTVWCWTSCLIIQSLSFFICKTETIRAAALEGVKLDPPTPPQTKEVNRTIADYL